MSSSPPPAPFVVREAALLDGLRTLQDGCRPARGRPGARAQDAGQPRPSVSRTPARACNEGSPSAVPSARRRASAPGRGVRREAPGGPSGRPPRRHPGAPGGPPWRTRPAESPPARGAWTSCSPWPTLRPAGAGGPRTSVFDAGGGRFAVGVGIARIAPCAGATGGACGVLIRIGVTGGRRGHEGTPVFHVSSSSPIV